MLTTLAMLSEAMAQAPNIDVEALYYQQDGTDLRVLAPKEETAVLDRILQVASERGMRGEIKSTNPRDQKIEGRLRFQKAGA